MEQQNCMWNSQGQIVCEDIEAFRDGHHDRGYPRHPNLHVQRPLIDIHNPRFFVPPTVLYETPSVNMPVAKIITQDNKTFHLFPDQINEHIPVSKLHLEEEEKSRRVIETRVQPGWKIGIYDVKKEGISYYRNSESDRLSYLFSLKEDDYIVLKRDD